jgi:hypothetical protein
MAMIDLRRAAATAAGALLLGALLAGTTAAPAGAGAPLPLLIEVTWTTDELSVNGQTSLREAVGIANTTPGPSVIAVAEGATYQLDLCGATDDEDANATGDLDHTTAQTLEILGSGATVEQTCPSQRVLEHTNATGLLQLEDLHVTGGDTVGSTFVEQGGGVRSAAGLDLTDVLVEGNRAAGPGGGLAAIQPVSISRSTVTDNISFDRGGGVFAPDDLLAYNSTISRNRAFEVGGLWGGDGIMLQNTTVVANATATGAANVHNDDDALTAQASIIALGSQGPDCSSPEGFSDQGFNVTSDSSCFDGPTSPGYQHPMLGQLGDNGGPTPTYRPTVGSPALDLDVPPCDPADDQRGATRLPPPGGACDAGSVEANPPACTQAFPDVGTGHPFFGEVCWLVQSGITGGYLDGTFKPGSAVTRQSMSAFIYRLALSPPTQLPASPSFDDVGPSHVFRLEVEWMAFEGITSGYPDGTFRPGAPVTRQSMSAFLFRLAGEPAFPVPTTPSFDDVTGSHPFYEEIEWMAAADVSTGYSDGTYRPSAPVSRAAMAAFLQRIAEQGYLGGI